MKKVKYILIFDIFIIFAAGLFFILDNRKEKLLESQANTISNESYLYADTLYDNEMKFNRNNSNVAIYEDNQNFYIKISTLVKSTTNTNDSFPIYNYYSIKKHKDFSVSQSDISVYSDRDQIYEKNFYYEIENISLDSYKNKS